MVKAMVKTVERLKEFGFPAKEVFGGFEKIWNESDEAAPVRGEVEISWLERVGMRKEKKDEKKGDEKIREFIQKGLARSFFTTREAGTGVPVRDSVKEVVRDEY